jgi:hypothetical protein
MGKQEDESPFEHIRNPKKRAFLAALIESGGNIRRAAQLANVSYAAPYTKQWKEDDEFQVAYERAREMGADHLEAEAIRRAYDGVSEPVGFYMGEPSTYVRKYSDTLLIFLLKGARPAKYAERHRVAGDETGPPIQVDDLSDVRERLAGRIAGIASRIGTTGFFEKPSGNGGSSS